MDKFQTDGRAGSLRDGGSNTRRHEVDHEARHARRYNQRNEVQPLHQKDPSVLDRLSQHRHSLHASFPPQILDGRQAKEAHGPIALAYHPGVHDWQRAP